MNNLIGRNTRIQTIRRAAPSAAARLKNPNAIGNVLINGKWFSGVEIRNQLIGIDMPTDLPLSTFHGAVINYKELTITQEMLDQSDTPGVYVEKINGRDIKYTKPGVANVELEFDWSTVVFTESTLMQCKIKALSFDGRRLSGGGQRPIQPAAVTPITTEVIAPIDAPPAPFPAKLIEPTIVDGSLEPDEDGVVREAQEHADLNA